MQSDNIEKDQYISNKNSPRDEDNTQFVGDVDNEGGFGLGRALPNSKPKDIFDTNKKDLNKSNTHNLSK
jgi:hypothetical protein